MVKSIFDRLYKQTMAWASHRHATKALGVIAFLESSIFPVPPDPLLIATILRDPPSWLKKAWICSIASVLGGVVGYGIGYGLYATLGEWIIASYGLEKAFHVLQAELKRWGFWLILLKGFTPIPYKVVTLTCGVVHFNLAAFVIASLISRGGRFLFVAALTKIYGKKVNALMDSYGAWVMMGFTAVLIGGFVLLYLLK